MQPQGGASSTPVLGGRSTTIRVPLPFLIFIPTRRTESVSFSMSLPFTATTTSPSLNMPAFNKFSTAWQVGVGLGAWSTVAVAVRRQSMFGIDVQARRRRERGGGGEGMSEPLSACRTKTKPAADSDNIVPARSRAHHGYAPKRFRACPWFGNGYDDSSTRFEKSQSIE